MAFNNLSILEALDIADTQWYHDKSILVTGMGFFTAAYNLFCLANVSKLLDRLYYPEHVKGQPGRLPIDINNAIQGVALVGPLLGQLVFGWLGDKLGKIRITSL
ncbi:putative ABC-type phosphate transporter [Helianthus anomalus]